MTTNISPMICNYSSDKLSMKEIHNIEKFIYNVKFGYNKYLTNDQRLLEIIKAGCLYLESVSITHKQIADKLRTIIGKHKRLEQLGKKIV
jgi:predicted Ser/Thr protein kinase